MINLLMSRGNLGRNDIVEHVKEFIKPEHKVLVVAFSFFEHQFKSIEDYHTFYSPNGEYYEKIIASFLPYGINLEQIQFLNYYTDDHMTAIKKIEDADIIYLPGGAPNLMMERIQSFQIKDALEKKSFFIGSSAGAMIQFKNYHISKDRDYSAFSYQEGLSLLEGFSIEVHYRRRKNQKKAMRKVFRAFKYPIYVIPDEGAMLIVDQKATLIQSKIYYDLKGVVR